MPEERLDEIGQSTGTDKSSVHHDFLRHYETHLALGRNPVRRVLEVGVYDGASLRMWQRYFPDAAITALDIDPRCAEFSNGNAVVEICDQSDALQLQKISTKYGPFDLVLDDGSHIWSHQILTFECLFPHVEPGGLYILEDIDTSYGHHVTHYGQSSTISAAQYVTKLANYILASTALDLKQELDLRMCSFVAAIDSITFIRRSVLIRKK